jgi:hypothetical protein
MNLSSVRAWVNRNESVAILVIAIALTASLYSFEHITGMPASVRSQPVYGTLKAPTVRKATTSSVSSKRASLKEKLKIQRERAKARAKARAAARSSAKIY